MAHERAPNSYQSPKRFTLAFKLHAIRKLERENKSPVQVAKELGLSGPNLLYSWRNKKDKLYETSALKKPAQLRYHSQVALLKSALRRITMERDILKKAVSYFVSQERRGTTTYAKTAGKNLSRGYAVHCR